MEEEHINHGIRYTFWIAGALITGAIFPLLGLMLGCLVAGMGLHASLTARRPDDAVVDEVERQIRRIEARRRERLSGRLKNANVGLVERVEKRRK